MNQVMQPRVRCPLCSHDTLVVRTFHGHHPEPQRNAYYCVEPACLSWFARDPTAQPGAVCGCQFAPSDRGVVCHISILCNHGYMSIVSLVERLQWVFLAYRLPREPSTPRIAVWRKLRRLGIA